MDEVEGRKGGKSRIFANEVGGEPENVVGADKGIVVLVFDLVLTGVLVGFVDDDETGSPCAFNFVEGSGDGGGDFFGVVGVVGIDMVSEFFEATADAGESIKDVDDLVATSGGGF